MFEGKVSAHSQKHNVTLSGLVDLKQFHLDWSILGINLGASTSFRTKNTKLVDSQNSAVLQTISDLLSDGTGSTNDTDRVTVSTHLQRRRFRKSSWGSGHLRLECSRLGNKRRRFLKRRRCKPFDLGNGCGGKGNDTSSGQGKSTKLHCKTIRIYHQVVLALIKSQSYGMYLW